MNSTRQQARVAGFLYLLLVLSAPFGLPYVPGKLIVSGNATATADNIRVSEWILRLGIASELIHQIICVFLVLALYSLFKAINEARAKQGDPGCVGLRSDRVRQRAQRHRRACPCERSQFSVRV